MNNDVLSPFGDIKKMNSDQLKGLCQKLRDEVIRAVENCGGHLSSNLGVVELTVALHRVLDLPGEKLIFDVGHQSYVHKMLSGRTGGFAALRNENGVSGFQVRNESEYDFFGGGHSGTAISAALGFAEAERLNGGKKFAVAVVGDGSFTNGMVYEALNNASKKNLKVIIILNDNEMSISKNVGGMSNYFDRLRSSAGYLRFKRGFKRISRIKLIGPPIATACRWVRDSVKRVVIRENIFENLGFNYLGPVDGHDIKKLETVFREAKRSDSPTVIHVCTVKGKGYAPAEEDPSMYHGLPPKGCVRCDGEYKSFSECFGKTLTELARKDGNIVAITAAMCEGTGLSDFKSEFKRRFYDVGIAEEHALTFAAGLAAAGKTPVFAVYSAFFQRSFDQLIHDVSVQDLPVVLALDRSGFVGGDGPTHQGIFDLSVLLSAPNTVVCTPSNYDDLKSALKNAVVSKKCTAVRYPKGGEVEFEADKFTDLGDIRYRDIGSGKRVNIVTYGTEITEAVRAAELLSDSFEVRVIGVKRLKPLNMRELYQLVCEGEMTVFAEEHIKTGGFSEHVLAVLSEEGKTLKNVKVIAVDEKYPTHTNVKRIKEIFGLDAEGIAKIINNSNI